MPCKKIIKRNAQTVNICPNIGLSLPFILLRRCVTASSQAQGILRLTFFKFSGSTKINKYHFSVLLHHHIGRLHITVNNRRILRMEIRQHITQLFSPIYNGFLFLRSVFLHNTFQLPPFYVVHYQQKGFLVFNNIYNIRKIGVMQPF